VETLTPVQLEKKRVADRASQQRKRKQTKDYIEDPEKMIKTLKQDNTNLRVQLDWYYETTTRDFTEGLVSQSADLPLLPHYVIDMNATTTFDEEDTVTSLPAQSKPLILNQSGPFTTSPGPDQNNSLQILVGRSGNREQSQDLLQPDVQSMHTLRAGAFTEGFYFGTGIGSVSGDRIIW
jgi:hypothetical protein